MPVHIDTLRCRVSVVTKARGEIEHQTPRSERPSLEYVMPMTEESGTADALPGEMANEGITAASESETVDAATADPKQVADRIYEIMKQEARLGRMRGEL